MGRSILVAAFGSQGRGLVISGRFRNSAAPHLQGLILVQKDPAEWQTH